MKREPTDLKALVSEYEQKMSEASVPLWMDAPDLLDILDYYEQNNQYFEAETCIRLALRLHPDDPEVQIRRAYRFKNEGRWAEADEVVRKMSDQQHLDVQFYYAERALSRMEFDAADTIYEKVLADETDLDSRLQAEEGETPMGINDLLLEIGELFLDYGHPAYARKYLLRIPEQAIEYVRAQLLQGEVMAQWGAHDAAREMAEKVLDADPYNLDAWLFLADISNEQKQFEKCVEAADFAIAIEPQNEKALRFKAIGELGLEHWDEVLKVYETYHALFPNDYSMALSAGEILVNRREFAQAREVLEVAAQNCPNENPDKIRIAGDLALTYAAEGDMRTAYSMLASTSSLGVEQAEIHLRTFELAVAHRQPDFAADVIAHMAQMYGFTPDARRRIAHALCENDCFDDPGSGGIWRALFNSRPEDSAPAAPYIAYAARRLKQGAFYLRWLEIALREEPQLTRQIFTQVYPFASPDALLDSARGEFPDEVPPSSNP